MISSKTFALHLKKVVWLILFLVTTTISVLAQDIKVQGGFLSDSLKVGEETAFYLSARYPAERNVLFPDSSFSFFPFEYQRKKYFPTRTRDGISYDSAVFYLTTFELDRSQFLSLPVYLVNVSDCTVYASTQDSIRLIHLVKNLPDTVSVQNLPLQANTDYHKVNFQFNYLIAGIALILLCIIAVIVWIIFGKRIASYFKAKKLLKRHREFVAAYNKVTGQLQKAFSSATTEAAVSLWKKYMEQLEARPYTKLTTRETLMLQKDELLGRNLHNIDMAIYGNATSVSDSLAYLKKVADQRFTKKLEEVKHGK
jgi:hypothetical protein